MKHYVPRLVLRKYAGKINIYNVQTGEYKEQQKIDNIFASDDLYSDELENKFNRSIEGRFGDLLHHKILNAKELCTITRQDVQIIKKFLLITMIRTEYMSMTLKQMDTITNKIKNKYRMMGIKFPIKEKVIANETLQQRWVRNINVILESKSLDEVKNHELVTFETWRWAYIFNCGYLGIWDNSNTCEDFVVTDAGMTSESDMPIFTKGIGHKGKYLLNEIKKMCKHKSLYHRILINQEQFHEHYFMFSISKNRMIVLINPFFMLYDKKVYPNVPTPTIWPSFLADKDLFEMHKIVNDLFVYKIKYLSDIDAIKLNLLMLDRIQTMIGISDLNRIRYSLTSYVYGGSINQGVNYDSLIKIMIDKEIICRRCKYPFQSGKCFCSMCGYYRLRKII